MRRPLLKFVLVFAVVVVVSFATFLPLCNLLFGCGCTATSAAHCNVHHDTGPKCPWCAHGTRPFAFAYGLILIGSAGSVALAAEKVRGRFALPAALAAGFIGYFIAASLVGLASALFYHYPTWYGLHVSS